MKIDVELSDRFIIIIDLDLWMKNYYNIFFGFKLNYNHSIKLLLLNL
jgi:hypothetical protein